MLPFQPELEREKKPHSRSYKELLVTKKRKSGFRAEGIEPFPNQIWGSRKGEKREL